MAEELIVDHRAFADEADRFLRVESRINKDGGSWCCRFSKKLGEHYNLREGDPVSIIIIPDPARDQEAGN